MRAAGSWWRCRRRDAAPRRYAALWSISASGRDDPRLRGAQERVPGLDDLVDDPQPLVERRERALHRVDREPFHLAEADAERLVERRELARQRDAAHQAVVCVDGDAVAETAEEVDRVVADGGGGTRVDVRARAHLEGDAAVADERGQPPELDRTVVADRDVVDDPHA